MLNIDRLFLKVAGKTLCNDLSLAMQAGECWAVLGQNGSGKTSLLHALAGLRHADGGEIVLEGIPLKRLPRRELARRIGILLQDDTALFTGTVQDYVLLGLFPRLAGQDPGPEDRAFAHQNLVRMALEPLAMRSLNTLSGGERQRARLAQLLTQDPAVFLLDEPLQHLDLPHQASTMRLFSRLAAESGRLVVMVLHDPSWASRCCSHALLLYGQGRISHGRSSCEIRTDTLENLYHCRITTVSGDSNYYFPSIE